MNDGIASIVSALRSREFDKALQLLQPALQSAPNNHQLWTFQGLAYSGKGEQKSALGSYQKALKSSPDYLPALEGAAQLEYEAGNTDPFLCSSTCSGCVLRTAPLTPCLPSWHTRGATVLPRCSTFQRANKSSIPSLELSGNTVFAC
jgi:tetratricopeptide (TPR) repeat protein